MKIIAIGDLHGKNFWKTINPQSYDKIVFLGDYVDAFNIKDEDILVNLMEIILFKNTYPDKVILLIGNHDAQYMYSEFRCSGFRLSMFLTLKQLFFENYDLFQIAFQIGEPYENDQYLFTHAGICSYWYKKYKHLLEKYQNFPLADALNGMFNNSTTRALFAEVGTSRGGWNHVGSPLWADMFEIDHTYLKGYHQIVGHNATFRGNMVGYSLPIIHLEGRNKLKNTSITFCDCLDQKNWKFYEFEIK